MNTANYEHFASGSTSVIYRIPQTSTIVKVPRCRQHFEAERHAYETLFAGDNPPKSILQYFGTIKTFNGHGLVLELAASKDLFSHLWHCKELGSQVPKIAIRRWALQAAEALEFVHDSDILHCDIYVSNFLLDAEFNLKLADFGAASIKGSPPLTMHRTTHQLWCIDRTGSWVKAISKAADIFALGCAMYHMETGHDLWADCVDKPSHDEVVRLLRCKRMPLLVDAPILGVPIRRCWDEAYSHMADLVADLRMVDDQGVSV